MRTSLRWLVLAASLLVTSGAVAQVEQGQVRLWIDTDLLSVNNQKLEAGDNENTTTAISVGPGGSALTTSALPGYVGIGVGYVAHPHIIPSLHFAMARGSSTTTEKVGNSSDTNDGPTTFSFMIRPELEIPFNPASKAVVSGVLGLDARRIASWQHDADTDQKSTLRGVGPAFGLATHFFVVDAASIDLSAIAAIDFLRAEQITDGDSQDTDELDTFRLITFGLLAGVSVWP